MLNESNDNNSDNIPENTNFSFKPKKRKPLRKRASSNESGSDENEINTNLEDLKLLQNLRKRPRGVNIVSMTIGKKISGEGESQTSDTFKAKAGGMVNMQALKNGKLKQIDDAYDTGIGTQFSVETNKRDEDDEMMKYIDEQLAKRKGKGTDIKKDEGEQSFSKTKYLSPEEAALQALPDHLKESSHRKNEEMLSNQMLNGIPEVDLGIEVKIKNIEATEEAKLRLLWEQNRKKDGPSQFVPTNMASNFAQHNRFNVDVPEVPIKKLKPENEDKKSKKDEKATDDYHYERFKKQFRRH
ncbi:telomere length and silencing protein 1 homolog [Agrilus planipennis]|uniref:Telomere length and silencing protein 1 homolog n=1 Tax=Agrilus planipennis TaxID=224129 RepID=A0A1W4WN24_AGRPL|nr:telomere length and silencing protein 1 homolog [Agrilus planipennis]